MVQMTTSAPEYQSLETCALLPMCPGQRHPPGQYWGHWAEQEHKGGLNFLLYWVFFHTVGLFEWNL